MPCHSPLYPRCNERTSCESLDMTVGAHPTIFHPLSIDPYKGLNFRSDYFTAAQIATGLAPIISGLMDLPIKTAALQKWQEVIQHLWEHHDAVSGRFDLQPVFEIFDDLFFLGVLKNACEVVWVETFRRQDCLGMCTENWNVRGKFVKIEILAPSPLGPRDLQDCLETLLHEMCHAVLTFQCRCRVCSCRVNLIGGNGLIGHGKAWQRVRRCVEDAANEVLVGGFFGAIFAWRVPGSLGWLRRGDGRRGWFGVLKRR